MRPAIRSTPPRRGSAYVLVLGLSAIIMTLALGAIALARLQARRGRATADIAHARLCAHAALQVGRRLIKNDPDWRDHFPNGTWGAGVPVGRGAGSLQGIDPGDGDLADNILEPVVLTGTGSRNLATQTMRVTLLADATGLGCLQTALHAGNDVKFNACTVQCDQTVSANNNLNASGADVWADAEAAGAVSGGTYHGETTSRVDQRSMPDPAAVLNEYKSRGTWIPPWALPWKDGARTIAEGVLSPGHNPYWPYSLNTDGIYYILCEGRSVCIRDCRIVGTLVLLDAGTETRLEGSVRWQPAVENYPALLVDGKLTFALSAGALDEAAASQNFNPSHTPYDGHSDADTEDIYPSRIEGLVYADDDAYAAAGTHTVHGVIVVGNTFEVEPGSLLNLRYDARFLNDPPPGFIERVDMKVSEGSYRRVVE